MLRNGLQPWHLLVVAVVAIVLMGSRKLPDTARSLGRSMRILKSETRAMKEDGGTSEGRSADAEAADEAASCPVRPGAPHPDSAPDTAGGSTTAPAPGRDAGGA